MARRYPECIRKDGNCAECSLSSYGRDCHNQNISKLAWARMSRGLTQQQLANSAGMNIRQLQKLEAGELEPANMALKKAIAMADALEIDPRELL